MSRAIWWIRRDLRLTDNQALHAAVSRHQCVAPLFIIDPALQRSPWFSARRWAFLVSGLHALDAALRQKGSRLLVRSGSPASLLPSLCREWHIDAVYAEQDHSPYAIRRDQAVQEQLGDERFIRCQGVAIRAPGTVHKDDGSPYTVFTPYSRKWRAGLSLQRADIVHAPAALATPEELQSEPLPAPDPAAVGDGFRGGEAEARRKLGEFVRGPSAPIDDYAKRRDLPAVAGTSMLSPYLRLGMISSRLAALGALTALDQAASSAAREGAESWLTELIWRDFYIALLAQFPHVRSRAFRSEYDHIAWRNDPDEFEAWCHGRTGYPFVDAAMRQLVQRGWMHNRARMVTASFLVKDLLIDWRWGEQWFMQQLLDGDPASNNGGWQWSAGTGADHAPYFRIFNPITQGKRFDPEGAYIRHWAPELEQVPERWIHEPWKMPAEAQEAAGCRIGRDYPAPIVDHKFARQRTLEAYKAVKG